jgi:hypothetical protein
VYLKARLADLSATCRSLYCLCDFNHIWHLTHIVDANNRYSCGDTPPDRSGGAEYPLDRITPAGYLPDESLSAGPYKHPVSGIDKPFDIPPQQQKIVLQGLAETDTRVYEDSFLR